MKISCRNKIIIACVLVAAFCALHYFVYLDNATGEVPIIQSNTNAPVDLPELYLCEASKPGYFDPLHKVTFSYLVIEDSNDPECNIVEQAESFFSSKMQPIAGDPYDYWDGFDKDGFGRPQIGFTFANPVFFLVQYLVIILLLLLILVPTKRK